MARRAASTSATEQLVERVGDWLIVRAALWTQLANLPGFQTMYELHP